MKDKGVSMVQRLTGDGENSGKLFFIQDFILKLHFICPN